MYSLVQPLYTLTERKKPYTERFTSSRTSCTPFWTVHLYIFLSALPDFRRGGSGGVQRGCSAPLPPVPVIWSLRNVTGTMGLHLASQM